MFNIGKLRSDCVAYYLGGVARSATDYYVGRGEAAGRWAGSLAPELGLTGAVEEEQLGRLLDGLHPVTGDPLVSAIGSNARARRRSNPSPSPEATAAGRVGGSGLDVARVAAQLQVSTRAVRHWLASGERVRAAVQAVTPGRVVTEAADVRGRLGELRALGAEPSGIPDRFLLGDRRSGGRGDGHQRWSVPQAEVATVRDERRAPSAQAGWDLVFRPPKSYSVLWAVGGEDLGRAIHQIHTEAVDAALAYLEDAAIAARAAHLGRTVRTEAEGLVVAVFDHRDSRAGDPLLHSHCVVANVTRRGDGKFVALEPRGLYRHGLAADAVYQTTFRHLSERRLGLVSEPVVNGWADVVGVPRAVVEHFSKRSEEIAAELARVGSDSAQARQVAALVTRAAKADREPDGFGLHERWQAEAHAVGFGPAEVAACLGRAAGANRVLDDTRIERLFDRLAGHEGLTAHATTFTRAQAVVALAGALGAAVDGRGVVILADRFLASGRVCPVPEHRPGRPRARILTTRGTFAADLGTLAYTTPDLVAVETRLLAFATAPVSPEAPAPVVPEPVLGAALEARPELDAQQRAMVEAVCRSRHPLRLVVGHPGAGKTFAAEAAVAAFRAAGIPVVGAAVTAEAADELAASTGLGWAGGTCDTLARVLLDLDAPEFGGLPPKSVVLVDEASMVPHRELDRLMAHVVRAGGALLLMGDPKQHRAVGPGGFFAWAVEHLPELTSELSANHRQQDLTDADGRIVLSLAEERLANEQYRTGHVTEALARRDAAGLVVRAPTAGALYDTIATDWYVEWRTGARDPMIATRNAVRDELNRRARVLRAAAGELGDGLTVGGREVCLGEYVVTRRNDRRLRSPDGSWYVKNGSRGSVVAVDPGGDVKVAFDGRGGLTHWVTLPASYVAAGHLEWAYAVTDYGVQGRTLAKGKAVLDDTTRAAGAYVATTRGRLENRIYVVDGNVAEPGDTDASHGPPAERPSSLEQIAHRLAADEPSVLLHEVDPHLSGSAPLAATASLAELDTAARAVRAALADGPPEVTNRLADAERRQSVLLARRRVTADRLAEAEDRPGRRTGVSAGDPAGRNAREIDRHRRTLDAIEDQLEIAARRIAELRLASAERARFLDRTTPERHAADVLRDAVALREATLRLDAPALLPCPGLTPPAEPSRHQDRAAHRAAVEAAVLYRDRFGTTIPAPGDTDQSGPSSARADISARADTSAALGPRPVDPAARRAWDRAAAAFELAARLAPSPTPATGAETAAGIEP